jgi:hypothetical protein
MAAQLDYNVVTPKGLAGELYDLNHYAVNSRLNAENAGVLKYGYGVVPGTTAGSVKLPTTAFTNRLTFEGIVLNSFTNEQSMVGVVALPADICVGILEWGRAWGVIVPGKTYAKDEVVYLVLEANAETGALPGMFSNTATEAGEYATTNNLALDARFLAPADNGIAPIEIFNMRTATPAG